MKRTDFANLGLFALALVPFAGCSGDDPASPPGDADTTPPAAVTDLRVESGKMTLTVAWTAPGDDGTEGQAAEYDIRFAGEPITAETFSAYTRVPDAPAPAAAGTEQSVFINAPGYADLFVALKTADEVPNWSAMSNVVSDAYVPGLVVRQLTTTGHNIHPCVNDGRVTWVRVDPIDGDEIYISDLRGAYPDQTALTGNGGEKAHPSSHGGSVIVWQGREYSQTSTGWEIFKYSYGQVPLYEAFTDNDVADRYPVLAGAGNFAWLQGPTMQEEVHFWNADLHTEHVISDECCPVPDNSNDVPTAGGYTSVVWRTRDLVGSEGYRAIYYHGTITDLTDEIDATMSTNYSFHDGTLAYQWGSPPEIRYWDGAAVHSVAEGYEPSLHDGTVAYEVWDGQDWEIHYWDGAEILEITDNDYDDTQPSLHDGYIAWVGRPGGGGNTDHIFYAELE